ncbi:type II toxin-antitoxin system VapC family toxin [Floridanema evergladense]|uniref:Type II toxin-antitoxin system VapC family toxin n=1 Tax=Floridaenema evergladense BLCC-F167 TaxID=3153639 RepID=A0ABV4WTH6_9CYAN
MVNAYFLDSSALVKRYVPETGTNWILSITDPTNGNYLAIAQITWVEVLSALSRRQREGSISGDRFDLTLEDFRQDFESLYQIIEIDQVLIERAGQLVVQYSLRAYDAIQLASAFSMQSSLLKIPNTQLVFVSADERLIDIVQNEGLVTENPNNYV